MQDSTQAVNNNKLYVGNLPYSTTEDDLRSLFSEYGEVSQVTLIIDRMSGRSKGFGFVEFTSEADAAKATEAMNGHDMQGRAMVVNVARPQAPRENRGGGTGGGGFRPRFSQGGGRGGSGGGRSNDRGGYGSRGGYDSNDRGY